MPPGSGKNASPPFACVGGGGARASSCRANPPDRNIEAELESMGTRSQRRNENCGACAAPPAWPAALPRSALAPGTWASAAPSPPEAWSSCCWKWSTRRERFTALFAR